MGWVGMEWVWGILNDNDEPKVWELSLILVQIDNDERLFQEIFRNFCDLMISQMEV